MRTKYIVKETGGVGDGLIAKPGTTIEKRRCWLWPRGGVQQLGNDNMSAELVVECDERVDRHDN